MCVLSSRFAIGERVRMVFHGGPNCGAELQCYVRAVTFTKGKVRYALFVPCGAPPEGISWAEALAAHGMGDGVDAGLGTTLHNVDSAFVDEAEGERLVREMPRDNYS